MIEPVRRHCEVAGAFAQQTASVAEAYAASLATTPATLAAAPEQVIVEFLATRDGDEAGHARTNVFGITINGEAATFDPAANTISANGITLSAMTIAILPDVFTPRQVPQGAMPQGVTIAYRYTRQVDDKTVYLAEEDALGISNRQVAMAPLDVLALQSGWASVFVQRNLALFPIADLDHVRTNDAFVFQTPEVRFANPIVPRLVYPGFSLDGMPDASGDLDALLTMFFHKLYAGGSGSTGVDVSMQGLYGYQLVAGAHAVPRVALPVSLLPSSPSVVSADMKPDFVAPFASAIADWRTATKPTTGNDAAIEIELKIFGASGGSKQPLIQVQRLTHSISKNS